MIWSIKVKVVYKIQKIYEYTKANNKNRETYMFEQRTMVILVSCIPITTEGLCVHMGYLIHLFIDSSTATAVTTSKCKAFVATMFHCFVI